MICVRHDRDAGPRLLFMSVTGICNPSRLFWKSIFYPLRCVARIFTLVLLHRITKKWKIESREGRSLRRRTTDPLLPSIIHEASERAQVHASRSKARAASAEANRKGHKFELRSLQLRDKALRLIRRNFNIPTRVRQTGRWVC